MTKKSKPVSNLINSFVYIVNKRSYLITRTSKTMTSRQLQKSAFSKCTLKKLILDCCSKITFSFNNQLYEQIDGISMRSSLGPVLANILSLNRL